MLGLLLATTLAAKVQTQYDTAHAKQLVPMLQEVLHFRTYEHNDEAQPQQNEWVIRTAQALGLEAHDAGRVIEVDLPAPDPNAPVLGLMVHGDVQPVDEDSWTFPPFAGKADDQFVYGRGAADDKGPLVQALLAMASLRESGVPRTHTVRLLVGSDEESTNLDIADYLKTHKAPDYSLVLDSEFPVVVGEKAWNSLTLTTPLAEREPNKSLYSVAKLDAGLATSIVPDYARIELAWTDAGMNWDPLIAKLNAVKLPEGTRLATNVAKGGILQVAVYGKSAHAGVNITGGRNALVALAIAMNGLLPEGGANDLLTFARIAGSDLYGGGLGITDNAPLWGRYAVNVATIKLADDPKQSTLTINVRSTPPRTGEQLESYLADFVKKFNKKYGASLVAGGYYKDAPLGFDPHSKMVKRLLADYTAATGEHAKPAISGGGTYAKRLPNAIAFGMWFPGKPYPGHDVDEKIPIADLVRGEKVLVYTLTDIATGPKMENAFGKQ
ncbi:MAG TPA: Sapep family Mn(2+)-dependent dipeptidase [Thermoanaerobaculia bacterium]|jgi:succinyl-diaminopimelate desuccinylase|nr:Sapep family Mn(2+)-dependent dipeptidase [Thermoanaerobaculia bacterium]